MKRKLLTASGVVAASLLATGAHATPLTLFETQYDTDFVSAGVGGMRGGPGTGTITLAGASSSVSKAYLYWHGPTNSTDPASANASVTFAGTDITGTYLGISDNNCWGFANSVAYRADVTSLVTGDGAYSLAGFTKSDVDINGASLIVFFDDGDDTNNRDVVMFDGNDSNITNPHDTPGWDITLAGIDYDSGTANAQFHVGDGQTFPDAAIIANATTLVPAGDIFQGDSVPTEGYGPSNGYLWDIKSFGVTSLLSPGLNTLNITSGLSSDCLSCVLIALDLPAGAAPVPEPGTLALLSGGLLAGAGIRRRRNRG